MHAISLAELSSTFVALAATMLDRKIAPLRTAAHEFWIHQRSRHDYWSQLLAEHRDSLNRTGASYRARKWHEILPVLQEILVTEPLSRALACFAAQLEEQKISDEFAALAQSVLVSHIEARHRCLHLIVFGNGLPVETAVKLNRIRRHLEAYSDNLIAAFPDVVNIDALCFDSNVVRQSRIELQQLSRRSCADDDSFGGPWLTIHMHLLAHQLWRTLRFDLDWRASSGRLNHRLSQAVLGMLPATAFDSLGVPRSLRNSWIGSSISTESDGKPLNPAVADSPLNLFFTHASHNRMIRQPNRRRW